MNKTCKNPEDNFKQAIREALLDEYETYVPELSKHTFSKEFESKMTKMIKRRRRPYYMWINTVGKRVACIVILIVIASLVLSANVEAIDKFFQHFEIRRFKEGADIWSDKFGKADEDSPKEIEEIYQITYDLNGYDVTWEYSDTTTNWIEYSDKDSYISFTQETKYNYDHRWNTEDAELKRIEINDNEGMIWINKEEIVNIVWDNREYVFSIVTENIDVSTSITIAESIEN